MDTIQNFLQNLLESLGGTFGSKIPTIIGALLLLFIGMRIAKFIKKIILKGLLKTGINASIQKLTKTDSINLASLISKVIYFIIVIYLLIMVMDLLGVSNVFEPVKLLLSSILGYIPNIIAAFIICYIGYIVAKIVSDIVGSLAGGISSLSNKIGINAESMNIPSILKQIVFLLVFVPILIVGLDALKMEVISNPASAMIKELMMSIPQIIAAVLIITVFLVIGKIITKVLVELLANLKVDELPKKMGFADVLGHQKCSKLIGNIVMFFIVFAGIIAGLEKLELTSFVNVLNSLMALGGNILLGLIIILFGNYLGNFAKKAVGADNAGTAMIVKFGVVGLTFSMGLSAMGIADDIVQLAFGLTLGAIAVAVALSFGLGGKEAAGKQMERILDKFK